VEAASTLAPMPRRRTKRREERTLLGATDADVLVCGASFAGLAVARELAGSGARVLIVDRYELGERQTSACAAPTEWLHAMGVGESIRQTFRDLVVHTPHVSVRMHLPWTFSTFDYPALCELLYEQCDAGFETATVSGRARGDNGAPPNAERPVRVATDRGEVASSLVVDCLGWRRVLDEVYQPPEAPLSRALEVHPSGNGRDLEIWIERSVVPAGYGWSFPAADELRVGVGSFDPHHRVKRPTVELAERLEVPSVRYQGNWIPHRLRPAAAREVFFVGDSAGHALPLTAEGIRTAFYFGIACGRELREVIGGRAGREISLRRYASFSAGHRWKFEAMLKAQRLVPRVPPRVLAVALRGMSADAFVRWAFGHYLEIAPPAYAREHPVRPAARRTLHAAA
jgi:flavin-dependent dehydrogenase